MERFELLGSYAKYKVEELARRCNIDYQDARAFEAWVNDNELTIFRSMDLARLEKQVGQQIEICKETISVTHSQGLNAEKLFKERVEMFEEQLINVKNLRKNLNL
jgi:hypothetical protein